MERVQGSGFRVQENNCKAAIIARAKMIANCKLHTTLDSGQCIHSPSLIPHPSSFIFHHSRRGISLMEVLISIFVLSIGLLGVAALIPLGQLALWETAKADRCGACGRAALREIQVSRLLDFRYWYWTGNYQNPTIAGHYWGFYYPPCNIANAISDDFSHVAAGYNDPNGYPPNLDAMPFVIDPLGRAKGLPEVFGKIQVGINYIFLPRRTLRTLPLAPSIPSPQPPQTLINADLFYWPDDLPFDVAKNSITRPKLVQTATGPVTTSTGDYSWFFTAMPEATEMTLPLAARRLFNVSVAVCYKRNFQIYEPSNWYPNCPTTKTLDGEHVATISANTATATGFPGMGVGGGTVQLDAGSNVNVKENQWVMLYHLHVDNSGNPMYPGYPLINRCNWYRVVGVGKTADASGNTITYINLNGPDWDPNLSAVMVVVPGVIGVYNSTMELDWDPLWTK
jgi:Prokaryotic N-terminal methylation motif